MAEVQALKDKHEGARRAQAAVKERQRAEIYALNTILQMWVL